EAALQAVMAAEGLLQVAQVVARGERLDGAQLAAVGLHPEDQAGADRLAVHQDRACPADAVLTPQVGPGEPEVLPQHVGQGLSGLDEDLVLGAVDAQRHQVLVQHLSSCSRASSRDISSGGVTGTCCNRGPWLRRASLRADSTVAGAPMVPPSPIPLAPVSVWS